MRLAVVVLGICSLLSCMRDPNVVKQRYLESGNKYFDRGKYKEATIMYRNALQKDARFGPAHYKLALAELKLGHGPQAYGALRRAVELLPENSAEYIDSSVKLADLNLSIAPRQKQYLDEVESIVSKLLQRDPNSFDGHRLRADYLYIDAAQKLELKKKDEAFELIAEAIDSYRKADSIKPGQKTVMMQLARAHRTLGKTEESEKLYRAIIEQDKTYEPAYMDLYGMYLLQRKPAEAEQTLKLAIANNPKQYNFLVLQAGLYSALKRHDEMVQVLNQIKSHAKEFDQAYLTVGSFYLRTGNVDEAIKQYREGMAADPKRKSTYQKYIIEGLMRQGKRTDAAQIAELILKDNPKDLDARGLQASLLLEKGDINKALMELQAVVNQSPDNPVARYHLGRAHAARNEWELARQQFQKSIELRPDFIYPRLALAYLHVIRGEFEGALKSAKEILTFDPQNGTARLVESAALMGLRKFNESRALLEQMAKVNPGSPDIVFQMGALNLAEKRFKDAEASFRKAYEMNPANSRGLLGLVETYLSQEKREEAIATLRAEADKSPARLDLRLALGNVLVRSGRYDAAVAEFHKGLATLEKGSKNAGDIHLRIGETYRRKADFAAAVDALQKARQVFPESPVVLSTLAMSLDQAGRKQEARQVYEQTIKLDPGNAVALNNLAFLMAETGGDLDQALTMAQRAKQMLPNLGEVSDTLGWIYLKKNLSDNAIEIFKDLVAKQPEHATYRYHLGMAFSQKGDKPKALKELNEALRLKPKDGEKEQIDALIKKIS